MNGKNSASEHNRLCFNHQFLTELAILRVFSSRSVCEFSFQREFTGENIHIWHQQVEFTYFLCVGFVRSSCHVQLDSCYMLQVACCLCCRIKCPGGQFSIYLCVVLRLQLREHIFLKVICVLQQAFDTKLNHLEAMAIIVLVGNLVKSLM